MNSVNEIEHDCAQILDTFFQVGEKVPDWADIVARKEGKVKHEHAIARTLDHLEWNKVIVMDPPPLYAAGRTMTA